MKKKDLLTLLFASCLLISLTMATVPSANAKTIDLTYSNFFPPTHIHGRLGDAWAKEIGKRTNGKVKITYFPGGALLKAPQMYDGILKGITDIGMSCFAYTRGRFPVMEAVDLPLGYTSGRVATLVINDFYKEFQPKELAEIKVLYLHAHGPGLLHSKRPVYKLEDLKGMKVRSTGFFAKVCKALGAVPVAMSMGGTYEALQKGVVEATASPIETLKGWKQAEVIKYTTECYIIGYTTGFYVMMNKEKWNSLPEDVQKVFDEVSAEWIAKHAEAWQVIDVEGRKYTLSLGNKIIPLSKEESARWAEAVKPVIDEWIKGAEGKGLPGKKYVETIRRLIKKY
jgi:TRAP-type C4-dicarboxylate transport system substrate-binding protein